MHRPDSWTLADVLDFEALTHADAHATSPGEAAARDARLWREQIAGGLSAAEAAEPRIVFRRWLEMRRGEEALPGEWLTRAWRLLAGGAIIAGLVLGFFVAGGALYYHGARPVNVAVFVAVTVGVQWLLLSWSALVVLSRGFRRASQQVLVRVGEYLSQAAAAVLERVPHRQRLRLSAQVAVLRQLSGRNLTLLQWPPLLALQVFGIAWNMGVLGALFARVLFTDVAFGWESTAAHGPHGMHALVHALAKPWLWLAPEACPTVSQVEHSWFHYQSGIGALDRAATASWWPWLAGVVIVYGLLPRLLLWLLFRSRLRSGLRALAFDEPRHKAAWYRVAGPIIRTEGSVAENFAEHGSTGAAPALRKAESGCLLIAAPLAVAQAEIERWVTTHLGWRLECSEVVEIDFPSGNKAALEKFGAAISRAPRWLLAVPAPFTAFSAFTQFIGRLTEGTKAPATTERFVLIAAVDESGRLKAPDGQWARYWSDFLQVETKGCSPLTFTP